MMRRRLLYNIADVPTSYISVQYLESTGTQYIDSGIECTGDLCVEFTASLPNSENMAFCGGINVATAPIYFRHHCSPSGTAFYWIQNSSANSPSVSGTTWSSNVPFHVTIDPVNGTATIDEQTKTFTPLSSSLTTGKNYGLFARIANDGSIQYRRSKIYSFKFYRNNVLIGDFTPCIRMPDRKPGMYDSVRDQFYVNQGTGEFITP